MTARLLPCGDTAVLVELDGLGEVLALRALLERERPAPLADAVPASRTLLVVAREPAALPGLEQRVRRLLDRLHDDPPVESGAAATEVEIAVNYDGPDLADVARLTGLTDSDVVEAHTASIWTVGFTGFAPGFAYLVGGDRRLQVPRRAEPRTSVPAGAVGLAGEFSGVYPRSSPGGWQLIGRTEALLWDVYREPPALLLPGHRVRFVDAGSP